MIEAQQMLMDITVAATPHIKDKDRRELDRDLRRKAYPSIFEEKRHITVDMLKAQGASLG